MPAEKTTDNKPQLPRRRWGLRVLALLGALLLLVWAAPMIVGWSGLVKWACQRAAHYINGSVHVGSASLGWFSPVVLHNVEVRDRDNNTVVQIQRIESDHSLLRLLINREDLGSFQIEKPKVAWIFRGNTSNLEELLSGPGLAAAMDLAGGPVSSAPPTLPHLHLNIVDAGIAVADSDTNLSWKVESLGIGVLAFNDPDRTLHLNLNGVLHDGTEAGVLKAEIHLQNVMQANPQATIKGRFSSLPLSLANVLVRRRQPGTVLEGSLQGHCHLVTAIKEGKPFVDLSGELIANHVGFSSPFLAEKLQLERLTTPCRLKLENDRLTVERGEVECDLGKAVVQGSVDFRQNWLSAIDQPAFDLAVDVNLPILAERLPRTLRLHEDIRLTAGQVHIQCKSQATGKGILWQGKLTSTDVRGLRGKHAISWSEPMRLEFQVRNLGNGVPLIDELNCTSRFIRMNASTTAEQFVLTAEADLQHLAEPLGEFVDLGGTCLAGKANAAMLVRPTGADQFNLQGSVQVAKLELGGGARQPWQEDFVIAKWSAQGHLSHKGTRHIESASFEASFGKGNAIDKLEVRLLDSIADLSANPSGNFDVHITGHLARWQQRSRAWTARLDNWKLGGNADVRVQVAPGPQGFAWSNGIAQVSNFSCTSSNLWIAEPTLKMETAGRWLAESKILEIAQAKLTCPTLYVEGDKLRVSPRAMAVSGSVQAIGELASLRKWIQDPKDKPGEPMSGDLVLGLRLEKTGERLDTDFNLSVKNFIYGNKLNPQWRDAEIRCDGTGSYDSDKDVFRVAKIDLVGAMLKASASGKIAAFTTAKELDLNGVLTCDPASMEPFLRPILGKNTKIAGTETRPFKVCGPLCSRSKTEGMHFADLKGETTFNWKSLKALGCDVGPAEAKAVLQQGWFQLYPIETSFNEGKLRLQPNLRLEPAPIELVLLPGRAIEKARLTPEMLSGALGFVLPLLARSAEADGLVSVTLEGGRVPLSAPDASEVKGTIMLHSAKLGPNPLVRELSALLKISPTACVVKDCSVPFHMIGGKVHHRDLELAFPEFTVRSSGAVGLDGSLAIVIEMPIPPKLAIAARLTDGQAKQMLRIPVSGTLEHPRPDPRALESLAAVLGRPLLDNQSNNVLPTLPPLPPPPK